MKTIAIVLLVAALALAQKHPQSYWFDGLWQGYDGEWTHVTRQVMALAEATPAEKYAWRPAPGVRTFSEVYMHIAVANYWLLSVTGPKPPEGFSPDLEKTVTQKAEVGCRMRWASARPMPGHEGQFLAGLRPPGGSTIDPRPDPGRKQGLAASPNGCAGNGEGTRWKSRAPLRG